MLHLMYVTTMGLYQQGANVFPLSFPGNDEAESNGKIKLSPVSSACGSTLMYP